MPVKCKYAYKYTRVSSKYKKKHEYPNNNFVQNIRHNSQLTLIKVTNSIHKHLNIIIYAYLHMQMAPG